MSLIDKVRFNGDKNLNQEKTAKSHWFNRLYSKEIDLNKSPITYKTKQSFNPELDKEVADFIKGLNNDT